MSMSPDDLEVLAVVLEGDSDDEPVAVVVEPSPLEGVVVVSVDDAPPDFHGAVVLDDLRDVDAPISAVGLLERQPDRVVRPVSREALLDPHVHDPTPHPAYDDMVDPVLWFDNALI